MEDEVRVMSFHPDMQQTPENVAKVLDIAGWTFAEAVKETRIHHARLEFAMCGAGQLTDAEWKKLLDVAGRRAFDWEDEQA